ncbi:unnamed protein product, partial [Polarella glacialis]
TCGGDLRDAKPRPLAKVSLSRLGAPSRHSSRSALAGRRRTASVDSLSPASVQLLAALALGGCQSGRQRLGVRRQAVLSPKSLPKHSMWGDVAVLPPQESSDAEASAKMLLQLSYVRSVALFQETGPQQGQRSLQYVAGDPCLETAYKECGLTFRIDLARRLSRLGKSQGSVSERERLRSLVRPGERVLVLGSGFGLTACILGAKTPCQEVIGVERNAVAHEYALVNIKANRLTGVVRCLHGDPSNDFLQPLGSFDRVCAFLPFRGANDEILSLAAVYGPAAKAVTPGGTLHLYAHETELEFENGGAEEAIRQLASVRGDGHVDLTWRGKVPRNSISPYVYRVGMDFRLT